MRGRDKLMEMVAGLPLIRRQAEVALAAGVPVWIILPPDNPLRRAAVQDLAVTPVEVPDAHLGLSRSIMAGNAAIPATSGILLWLADLPEIETTDLVTILTAARAHPDSIIRATTATGDPGHPVYFPPIFRGDLAGLAGDDGASKMLKMRQAATVLFPLPGNRARVDLDTPEDWADWRAKQT